MKKTKTVQTLQTSNRKKVETEAICIYIYMTAHCPGLVKSLLSKLMTQASPLSEMMRLC